MYKAPSIVFILIALSSSHSEALVDFSRLSIRLLADFRLVHTDQTGGWLDRGPGMTRYGGSNGESDTLLRVSQLSVIVSSALKQDLFLRAQINIDAEPWDQFDRRRVDLIEGYVGYRFVLSPYLRMRFRGGFFFPPVSLENRDMAWTSPYTITASSVNSWIGEEVRVAGGEASLIFEKSGNQLALSACIFGKNDPTASLLAWRGWSLSDRQTGLGDRLPLAFLPSLLPGGLFPQQPEYVQPFREVDGRPGYFGAFSWTHRHFEANGLHYDNRGIETSFDGSQYAWNTKFGDLGILFHLPYDVDVLSQFLSGNSQMGFNNMVDIDYRAGYVLISKRLEANRISLRFDRFYVSDHDLFVSVDNNNESGHAWTFAYALSIGEKFRVAAELLRVDSNRPERATIGLAERTNETLFQASFRVRL